MPDNKTPPFYVGYMPKMDPRLARWLRWVVGGLVGLCFGVALVIGLFQNGLYPAFFAFNHLQRYEGVYWSDPLPYLDRGDQQSVLVLPGKHGVSASSLPLRSGTRVRLMGKVIKRDGQSMIEMDPMTVRVMAVASPQVLPKQWGEWRTVVGEIVDSKCFLGVMNPGQLKTHKACAILCIRGGIPPMLVIRRLNGGFDYLWLVGKGGRPIGPMVVDYVGEPVDIETRMTAIGGLIVGEVRRVRRSML